MRLAPLLLLLPFAACHVAALEREPHDRTLAFETRPIELPERTAPPARVPRPPRAEPLARDLPPVSLHLAMRVEDAAGRTVAEGIVLHVRRTDAAVHLHDRRAGEEWLFRRNPVDPARLTAERILHSHRLVLRYAATDLRDAGLPYAFGPLALLGIDSATLAALQPDGRQGAQLGTVTRCLESPEGDFEAWWSDELRLPARAVWTTHQGGRIVQEVLGLTRGVDDERLTDPGLRLPDYRRLDLCDWREESCGCGGTHRSTLEGWVRAR